MESSITYQDADDAYRALRTRYVHELKRLRRSGDMSQREYADWELDGLLDPAKFSTVRELWDKLEATWPQTKRGRTELAATSSDSPLSAPAIESSEDSPLDAKVRVLFANVSAGNYLAADLASMIDSDAVAFLISFRRVRERLEGIRAYETLLNGQLAVEIVSNV